MSTPAHRVPPTVLAALLSAAGACGPTSGVRPAGATAATPSLARIGAAPVVELERLPMPSLAVPWEPPVLVAGDVAGLTEAIAVAGRDEVRLRVVTSERFAGERGRRRMDGLLAALGAEAVDALSKVSPAEVIAHPLPVVRTATPGGARPRYDAGGLAPGPRRRELEGAPVIVIEDAEVDETTWRALPAAVAGSCDAPLQALALGQERSLAALEAPLDHADRVLAQMFRAELIALLPPLVQQLAPWAGPRTPPGQLDAQGLRERECGAALAQWVEVYRRCTVARAECTVAPRMFLVGGVRIAAREPDVFVPAGCTDVLGTDPIARVRALAKDATEAAVARLDPGWVELADRLGTVTELGDAMTDICAPRRRRFAPDDLDQARAKLAAIGEDLASDEPPRSPRWVFDDGTFRVPGVGPVREIARYDAGPGSASSRIVAGARGLRQFVLSRAICRASPMDAPLAVTLWPAGQAAPSFFGYFYEEELACAELAPLR